MKSSGMEFLLTMFWMFSQHRKTLEVLNVFLKVCLCLCVSVSDSPTCLSSLCIAFNIQLRLGNLVP